MIFDNKKSHDTCWVYVFARNGPSGLTSPVKVGISRNVSARLNNIQTACPFPVEMAYVFECPNRDIAQQIELSFHQTQRENRAHGEWFEYEPVKAIHILCVAFRSLLSHYVADFEMVDTALDVSGVYWAEKRFNLAVPSGTSVQ